MNRIGLDLGLILLMFIDVLTLSDPNVNEGVALPVLMVNTILVAMYVCLVIAPRYIQKISNDDLRHIILHLCVFVPLIAILFVFASNESIDIEDSSQIRIYTGAYLMIGVTVIAISRIIISHFYRIKKEKEINTQSSK